jgi:hypothetical protein
MRRAGFLLAMAVCHGQQVHRDFAGPCASADPVYSRITSATGGQQYLLRGSEVEKSAAVMESRLSHDADILFAAGTLRRGQHREFQVPVDSTVESLSFSVTVECKEAIQVLRPSGEAVTTGTEMVGGRIVTVNRPETGLWRARVAGSGQYSVSVRAKSELDLVRFEFVRVGGRPGHEGLFPIQGQPTNPDQMVRARLTGTHRRARFKLISESGETIQGLELAQDGEEFTGQVRLPAQAFRVAVEGEDERGSLFERVLGRRFELQVIEILPLVRLEELQAGTTTKVSFQVRNLGEAAAFQASVVWVGRNFIRTPPPMRLALAAGGAAVVEADVDVPADAVAGTEVTVTVVVTRTNPPGAENGVSLAATVR